MKLEKFKKLNNATVMNDKALKSVKGGEYGDVDWDFWRRYFVGDAGNHAGYGAVKMGSIYSN